MKPLRTSSWALVILLCAYCALAGASLGKVIPLIPDIVAAVGATPLRVSLLLSVVAVVAAVLAPVAGWFSDRFGDRLLLGCGIVALTVGSAAGALSGSFATLFAGRCAEGIGFISMLTGVAALMMRTIEGPRQATAMALFGAVVPAGIGISEALAGLVAGGDWHNAFWGHCLALGVGLPALVFVPAWRRTGERVHGAPGAFAIYRLPNPLRLGACIAFLTVAQFGITSLFPAFLHTAFAFPMARAAGFGAVGLLASILGSVGAGAILARGAGVRALVLGSFSVVGVAGALVFAVPAGAGLSIMASIVFFISGGFANGLLLAVLPRILPDPAMRGRAGGLVNQCSNVGILAAPPLVFAVFAAAGNVGMAGLIIAAASLPLLIMPIAASSRRLPAPAEAITSEGA